MKNDSIGELSERIEHAWKMLRSWAETWHRKVPKSSFVGTLGGASQTELYFADVPAHLIPQLLATVNAELKLATATNAGGNQVALNPRNSDEVAIACGSQDTVECFLLASARVSLTGGDFEYTIVIEKTGPGVVDVRFTWIPLLAFFNTDDLKIRFAAIFSYLLSWQEELQASKALLCLERAPNPRVSRSGWMEI